MEKIKIYDENFVILIKDGVRVLQFDVDEDSLPQNEECLDSTNLKNLSCSHCRIDFTDCLQQRSHFKLDWHRYNLKQSLLSREPLSEDQFYEKTVFPQTHINLTNRNIEYLPIQLLKSPKRKFVKPKLTSCISTFEDHLELELENKHYLNYESVFLQQTDNVSDDDISSISGSDSEIDEGLDYITTRQGKLFLQNNEDSVFSLYRNILFDKKEEIQNNELLTRLQYCHKSAVWTVLMLGGGHFAGAVFQRDVAVVHKTFHCYTVRAGQGGSQMSRDNYSCGSHPKSAGASLRRYNEQSFVQHIRCILETWSDEIAKSSIIIYRATGPFNRAVLFGGKTPLLHRLDPRLRTVPFSTRRATFSEVKRVHDTLTTVCVYASPSSAVELLKKYSDQGSKRNKVRVTNVNRAKSRESVDRPLPVMSPSSSSSDDENQMIIAKDIEECDILQDLTIENLETSMQDVLQPFEDTLTPKNRNSHHKKKKKPKKSKSKQLREKEERRKKELIAIVSTGKLSHLQETLQLLDEELTVVENLEESVQYFDKKLNFLNELLDEEGNTMLHLASKHEQTDLLRFLLENGADPCIKNNKQQTPYTCTQNKIVRETFKQFAQEYPEKYNYNKAHVPLNTLTPEEQAERKKFQRKIKREKEKEKKKSNECKKKELQEQERFLNLSDREKRALAAEKRILDQWGSVVARCFLCAADIAGKVPFEYSGNRFCSVDCLKAHRLQKPIVLS